MICIGIIDISKDVADIVLRRVHHVLRCGIDYDICAKLSFEGRVPRDVVTDIMLYTLAPEVPSA